MRDTPETAKQIKALAMALARLEQEVPGLIASAEHAQLLVPQYLQDRLRMIMHVGQHALSQLKAQSIDEVKRQLTAIVPMVAATAISRIHGIEEWLPLVAERGQEAWEIVAPALRQEGHDHAADQLAFAGRTVRMYALEADNAHQRLEKESRSRQDIRDLIRRHVYDFNTQPGNAYRYRHVEDIAEDLGLALDTVGHEVVYLVGTDEFKVHNHPIGTAYPRVSITPKGQDVIDTPPLLLAAGQETPQIERAQDIMDHQPDYDVAISFAGEDRPYAKTMAEELKRHHVTVFYDENEKAQLWGKDLYTHLIDVYQHKARYCIMFLSQHYARKLWTNHERQAAQARAFSESQEYILPIRLDNTDIPGILSTTGYLNWAAETPESIADAILAKLGLVSPSPVDGSTTVTAELLDPALARLLAPDDALWAHIQRQIFAYRNVYDLKQPPYYMIALRPMTPIAPIPITEDERSDEAFKRLCAHLFGSSDAYWTDVNGIIFDPYSVGDATPDDHPPYGCAYVDGSIGLRDSISFTSHWEEKRPTPLKINLPGLWKLLSRALRAVEEWPRLVGRYTGPLEVHLSLGNMNDTVVVYPHDRSDPPRTLNRAPSWDASRFEWHQGQDVNDLLEQHLASLARLLQFGAYPSFKQSIRREATE